MRLFQWLGRLLDNLISWLGRAVAAFLEGLLQIIQRLWEGIILPVLIAAFGYTKILHVIFYLSSIGENIMEIWDPYYVNSKPSKRFKVSQALNSPLPKRGNAPAMELSNYY